MTVKELKATLSKMDDSAEVRVSFMDEIHEDTRISIVGVIYSKKEIIQNFKENSELDENAENSVVFVLD